MPGIYTWPAPGNLRFFSRDIFPFSGHSSSLSSQPSAAPAVSPSALLLSTCLLATFARPRPRLLPLQTPAGAGLFSTLHHHHSNSFHTPRYRTIPNRAHSHSHNRKQSPINHLARNKKIFRNPPAVHCGSLSATSAYFSSASRGYTYQQSSAPISGRK